MVRSSRDHRRGDKSRSRSRESRKSNRSHRSDRSHKSDSKRRRDKESPPPHKRCKEGGTPPGTPPPGAPPPGFVSFAQWQAFQKWQEANPEPPQEGASTSGFGGNTTLKKGATSKEAKGSPRRSPRLKYRKDDGIERDEVPMKRKSGKKERSPKKEESESDSDSEGSSSSDSEGSKSSSSSEEEAPPPRKQKSTREKGRTFETSESEESSPERRPPKKKSPKKKKDKKKKRERDRSPKKREASPPKKVDTAEEDEPPTEGEELAVDKPPAKEASPAKEDSHARDKSPAKMEVDEEEPLDKDVPPPKEKTPEKEAPPGKVASPARDKSPAKDKSPVRGKSPARVKSPSREKTPERERSPSQGVVVPSGTPKKGRGRAPSPPKTRSRGKSSPATEKGEGSGKKDKEKKENEATLSARILEKALATVNPQPSLIRTALAPDQYGWRCGVIGPEKGSQEEYAFYLGYDYAFEVCASKILKVTTSYKNANSTDKKGKVRRFGAPWPIPYGQQYPPGIGESTTLGHLGAKDIGIPGWNEFYRAARAEWATKHPRTEFGDRTIKEAKDIHLEPRYKEFRERESIRNKFLRERAEAEAAEKEKFPNLLKEVQELERDRKKPTEGPTVRKKTQSTKPSGKGIPREVGSYAETGIDPTGQPSVFCLGSLKDAMDGKKRTGEASPRAGSCSLGKHPFPRKDGAGPSSDPFVVKNPMVYLRRLSVTKEGSLPEAGVGGAVADVVAQPGLTLPFTMSYNKTLSPLGYDRASLLAGDTVVTFGVSNGKYLSVARYDPEAPVFFNIREVAAAVTKKDGPAIVFDDPPPKGEEKP